MANKIVDYIRRTGSATSPVRNLVVVQGTGKSAVETVLSTSITKLSWGLAFRHGAAATPVEQYAFQVGKRVFERFADAAAVVLKRHNIELAANELDSAQTYVQDAFKILRGEQELREITPPAEAVPATVTRELVA
jgi:hypothetical protein